MATAKKVKITKDAVEVNLSGVTASDRRRKKRIPEGTYNAKIVSATTKKFGTGSKGVEWVVEVTDDGKGKGARLWYNNVLIDKEGNVAENSLWSFRGFLQAIEPKVKIPDSMVKIPVGKLAGRAVAIEVVDGEDNEGNIRSEIADVFHPSLLDEEETDEVEDDEEDFEDEEDLDDLDEEEEDDDDEVDLDEDEL